MKTQKTYLKMLALGLLSLGMSTLVACNKDSGSSGSPAPAAAAACGSGYVQHASYGCLPQSNCPANYGMYQNQCIVLTASTTTCTVGSVQVNGQCLPQGNCPAGYAFNGSTCIAATNVATTPQPYPTFNPAYGAYNNGYYNNYSAWAAYYQQPYYYQQYQQPMYYYQQPTCYGGCGGGAGLGIYFGLRL